ncbi:thymidylate synthase [Paenibacillus sp. ACRRY]|uniref:YdeI/OmpD-associated family protein n=1 Tax=Paenibacillus sp. ACRRY TaxID=2918208 RepID=UPI001EF576E4|nr:thymidylate synthase [Paenibacillus sp. ACRRY]MCG7381974.1 thymidylate synthase [Paenibacillus sp. ACRRY]
MEIQNLLSVNSREDLRLWLQTHCRTETSCWVIVSMTPKPGTLYYLDVVEESLCFGWIDGLKKKISNTELAQRLSPRSHNSSWTELNKERVRRLEKLGFMRDEGRHVLPNMAIDSFRIPENIEIRVKEDTRTYENFMAFPALYTRVRIDTIQSVENQPAMFNHRLDKFITHTRVNKMYGQWNDGGRLLYY